MYIIDSLRSHRPGIAGPQGVNEVRLRRGRIVRDGIHTTLTEMRLRRHHKSAWHRWVAEHGRTAHFFVVGRDKAKLTHFWRHSFQIARCGPNCGAVINADSGLPVILDDESHAGQAYEDAVARLAGEQRPMRFLDAPKKGFLARMFGG